MHIYPAGPKSWRGRLAAWRSPFTSEVPPALRDRVVMQQSQRLESVMPLLCLTIMANAIAMALAVAGDLPLWQQITPPLLIVAGGFAILIFSRWRGPPRDADAARRQLSDTLRLAIIQGLVSGFWCVNAFVETERYYCMVAPVFIGIAAIVNASCLLAVPRAAIAGIAATLLPIVIKMSLYDNLGVRAMAVMMVVVGLTQSGLVLAKFRETVASLVLQDELNRLAMSDALTGLGNRLAFRRALDDAFATDATVLVAMADLDGFKAANDSYGHHAGDQVLIGVARRLASIACTARAVARLGGDEFALLYILDGSAEQAMAEIDALRTVIALPIIYGDAQISVSTCIGVAASPDDGDDPETLLRAADSRLYVEKRLLQSGAYARAA